MEGLQWEMQIGPGESRRRGLSRKTLELQGSSERGQTRQTGSPRDSLTVEEAHTM